MLLSHVREGGWCRSMEQYRTLKDMPGEASSKLILFKKYLIKQTVFSNL